MSTNFILTDEQPSNQDSQLAFDFSSVSETTEKTADAVQLVIPNADNQYVSIPHLNTPDNFVRNFTAISGNFESDTVEAARYLLRVMSKSDRDLTLNNMQLAGCSDRESYHRYLTNLLQTRRGEPSEKKGIDNEKIAVIVKEFKTGLIDENTANYRLRTEAGYPVWLGCDQLLQTKSYIEWQSILERHNNRKYDFINTLPINEQFNAREWLGNNKYLFNGESKSIGNYINEQMDLSSLTLTSGGVNGINLGKYGSLFAQYLINSLQAEQAKDDSLQNSETVQFQPFGAWSDFNSRLSLQERERLNKEALAVLEKAGKEDLSEFDKTVLRRYSGFGGISASGEKGVLYDYYTSPPAARLVWKLLEKSGKISNGAKILEPSCGTGVFFEYAPRDKLLNFTGVELDNRTAKIAEILHSDENTEILNISFEAFNLSDREKEFDCVIGNVPFGERGTALSSMDMPEEKSLDNYFISRSIDRLKDGGAAALIAASGVLENKSNEEFRTALNKKAQFAGAVKLPNRSFRHSHTQAAPDILLFRKYPKDIQERLSALDDETFKAAPLYDNDFVNGTYFEKHPRHIAGSLSKGTGQWGGDEVKGDITAESLEQILSSFTPADLISEDIFNQVRDNIELPDVSKNIDGLILSYDELKQLEEKTLRHGAIKISVNRVYILSENHSWIPVSENVKLAQKILNVKTISVSVHAVQDGMRKEKDNAFINRLQKQCITLLLDYWRKYNSLPVDDPDLKRFTKEYPAVQGVYEAFLKTGDPLLTQENIYRRQVDLLDGHNTAVTALLQLREKMKEGAEDNLRELFPDTADALIIEMQKHEDVFITPEGCFQLREDFIAGDAWEKIDTLKAAAEKEDTGWKKEKLLYGACELEKAVGWTPIEDAVFSPRSSWVPQEIVREWASGKEALGHSHLNYLSKNNEGKWGITSHGVWQEYPDPLVYYLNGQKQRSRFYDTESYNKGHDELFRSFIANHEDYRSQLESEYNRKFKTHITAPVKTYSVEIAGWKNAEQGGKTLKPHQWQSVHHLYRNQCGISALGTGFGKTVTAVSLMSLLRQESKAHRIFLQVPNNKVKDWIEEIHSVMPSLKIASTDPEDPGYSSRDKRYTKYQAMARSGAYIILMPESSASEIQLSPENDAQVTHKVSMLYKSEKSDGTARQQETAALKGEYKAASGKTNVTVCFEDFGCDALFVDEAHRYKNLFSSSLSRETGMNDGRQSAKAMSLFKKSEYIREKNNGKNVYLLTATPLTNSPLEYYNMMQYIAPDELRRMGVATIDGFIREFADIKTGWLYDWSNGQAKLGHILTGFKNLPTLQNLFFTYTDLQNNPDAAGLEKPFAENRPHIIPSDKKQTEAVKAVSIELDRYKSLNAEERKGEFPGQNFLTFYSQMRTASFDLELFDPDKYKNWKNPKLETLARNAFDNFQNTKGGQVVFCDRFFSSDASFNIHEKIKGELILQGFKEKDVVIVNGFTKSGGSKSDGLIEKEVSKAIADYNSGKYKVIIGSTACIGEGVNLQKNSSAVHHFDIPFRPSDFIQRNGRVDRQGNEQEKVGLHTYLATGTIDNYSVNLVQRKANWIDQMLRTKSDVFTNPNDENSIDADELLLALTEEWGDKDAAVKRKEMLELQKQEKIKEAQVKQMKVNLKNLSLARGALLSLECGKQSKEYQKRMGQITSLEASLKNNSVFTKHEILENCEPYLYDNNSEIIYRKNDVIIVHNGTFLIEDFNFKKQELSCMKLESDEERKERFMQARMHNGRAQNIVNRNFSLSELCGKERGYSHNEVLYHLEKTSKDLQEMIKDIGNEKFYKFPEGEKEKYYDMHTAVIRESYGNNFNPVVFSVDDKGRLEINRMRYCSCSDNILNPFSSEGKTSILNALEKGIKYSDYGVPDMLETLGKTIPELKDVISQAVENSEKQKQADKQDAALKKELLKQAAVKTNADTNHLKNHVHVVR
jgi:cyclopropane fatty-acyl-phospholipid synthase-like methyltransferase